VFVFGAADDFLQASGERVVGADARLRREHQEENQNSEATGMGVQHGNWEVNLCGAECTNGRVGWTLVRR
jgi:hypothetical protein